MAKITAKTPVPRPPPIQTTAPVATQPTQRAPAPVTPGPKYKAWQESGSPGWGWSSKGGWTHDGKSVPAGPTTPKTEPVAKPELAREPAPAPAPSEPSEPPAPPAPATPVTAPDVVVEAAMGPKDWKTYIPVGERGRRRDILLDKLVTAGASIATQAEFIRAHPDIRALPGSRRALKQFSSEVEGYEALTGDAQFRKAIELGFVPEGSEFVPAEKGKPWGYIPAEAVAKREAWLKEAGFPPATMEQAWASILASNPELEDATPVDYDPTTGEVTYELPPPTVLPAAPKVIVNDSVKRWWYQGKLISQSEKDRTVANYEAKRNELIRTGQMYSKAWFDLGPHPLGMMTREKLPLVTIADVAVPKETASLLSTVWQALTPWKEEGGETFWDFVKGAPQRLVSPDIPSQKELAATYKAEQSAPLWSRILFGPTVAKDLKTGKYYPQLE